MGVRQERKARAAKRIRPVEVDGQAGYEYEDGTLRKENGQLMKRPANVLGITTSEQGRALNKRRYDLAREDFAKGFVEGAPTTAKTPAGAWEAVGKKVAEVFFNATTARGLEGLLSQMGKLGGWTPANDAEETPREDSELRQLIHQLGKIASEVRAVDGEVIEAPQLQDKIADREAAEHAAFMASVERGIT